MCLRCGDGCYSFPFSSCFFSNTDYTYIYCKLWIGVWCHKWLSCSLIPSPIKCLEAIVPVIPQGMLPAKSLTQRKWKQNRRVPELKKTTTTLFVKHHENYALLNIFATKRFTNLLLRNCPIFLLSAFAYRSPTVSPMLPWGTPLPTDMADLLSQ